MVVFHLILLQFMASNMFRGTKYIGFLKK